MTAFRQLAFPFPHAPHYDAEPLPTPGGQRAAAWLANPCGWPGGRLALWGDEGVGKTHLLHGWAARVRACVLHGPQLHGPGPRDIWPVHPLAIDDADLAHDAPLLHVLNAAAEAGRPVLLAARTPPGRWRTALPDLRSRLRAVAAVELPPGDDLFLRTLLVRLLSERQLAVAPGVQDWLLARLPRTPGAMREAAARLDRAALAAGRAVTRGLAAQALAEMLDDSSAEPEPETSPDLLGLF